MPRQRHVAGQRSRSRLEPSAGATPTRGTEVGVQEPAEPPRRTAVLDRAPAAPPAAPAAAPARRRPDLLVLVAAVLVAALVLTAVLVTLRARAADRAEQARTDAVAAAESHAAVLLSYDHRRLDRDFARAAAVLTGGFAKDYARTTETVVRPTAEQVDAVVKADVVASAVVTGGQNRVVVLLFVNQSTTSNRVQGTKVDLNRVRMTLLRVGDGWKVSGVKAL